MLEHLNLILFAMLNANADLAGWQLYGAIIAAQWLILLVPLILVLLWLGGAGPQREVAVRACLAAVCALALNMVIGMLWFNPRPFMAEVGHTFMYHAPDSSFPSDHATGIFSVALVLVSSRVPEAGRLGVLLLPLSLLVAWSRVFLGIHWPMDMIGSLMVSAAMARLFSAGFAAETCALLVRVMETVYRRLLAAPIARGWLRP